MTSADTASTADASDDPEAAAVYEAIGLERTATRRARDSRAQVSTTASTSPSARAPKDFRQSSLSPSRAARKSIYESVGLERKGTRRGTQREGGKLSSLAVSSGSRASLTNQIVADHYVCVCRAVTAQDLSRSASPSREGMLSCFVHV